MSRAEAEVVLPIALDRADPRPLTAQVADAVRAAVVSGALAPGDRLPSSRALAAHLALSRGTVVAAYEQLDGEGYLSGVGGSGTRVAEDLLLPREPSTGGRSTAHGPAPPVPVVDLMPGRPDTGRLGGPAWRAAWRAASAGPVPNGEVEPAGDPALRAELVAHLRQVRSLVATVDQVVVTSGTRHGLAGVVGALTALRARPLVVGVEDPGWPSAARVLARAGARPMAVPVDGEGMDVAALAEAASAATAAGGRPVDAVLVTPAHQYPLGGAMPLRRRLALLAWAAAHGAVVLEDDYDSELRHVGPPLPTLASLAAGGSPTVVHLGSFSKSLSPWVRAGWLVVPEPVLREEVLALRDDLGDGPGGPVQRLLAGFMASGGLRRHAARTRRDHRHRRAVLLREVAAAPHLSVRAVDGGLHAVVELPPGTVAAHVVAAAASRGVVVADLADYRVPGSRRALPPGVVVGYGGASTGEVRSAVRLLAGLALPGTGSGSGTAGTGTGAAQPSASSRSAAARAAATAPEPGATVASTVAPS